MDSISKGGLSLLSISINNSFSKSGGTSINKGVSELKSNSYKVSLYCSVFFFIICVRIAYKTTWRLYKRGSLILKSIRSICWLYENDNLTRVILVFESCVIVFANNKSFNLPAMTEFLKQPAEFIFKGCECQSSTNNL